MSFFLDTADIKVIESFLSTFPLSGVTTNPSIIKRSGVTDFFGHMRQIKALIGPDASLHVQVVSDQYPTMLEEAHRIIQELGADTYIKVPVTVPGLKLIKELKAEGIKVTATAIYSEFQAYLAMEAGVDYLAPYVNRMENLGLDALTAIRHMRDYGQSHGLDSQILGASYKSLQQVTASLVAGAHAVTVDPALLELGLSSSPILGAVADFAQDWSSHFLQNPFDS